MNGQGLRYEAIKTLQLYLLTLQMPRVLRIYMVDYALKSLDVLEWVPPLEYNASGLYTPPAGWTYHDRRAVKFCVSYGDVDYFRRRLIKI